jgi:hypothetical protein
MNKAQADFAAKLSQIEEQANSALQELPAGLVKNRVQHIAVVARMLRSRLEDRSVRVVPGHDGKWARKNRTEIYKIAARLIPTELMGANEDGEHVVRVVHDAR